MPSLPRRVELCLVGAGFLLAGTLAAFHTGWNDSITFEPLATTAETNTKTLAPGDSVDDLLAKFQGPPGSEYRGGDLASYLLAARRLLSDGDFEPAFIPYWPPGMVFLNAVVLAVTGPANWMAKMMGVSVLLWALAMLALYAVVRPTGRMRVALFVFMCAFWLLPAMRSFTFGFGSVMTESSSTAFFLAFLAVAAGALWRGSMRALVLAGVPLAIATYLRVFFEIGAWFVLLLPAVVMAAGWVLLEIYRHAPLERLVTSVYPLTKRDRPFPAPLRIAAALVAALVVMHLLIVPWRMYRKHHFGSSQLTNFEVGYIWGWAWVPSEKLPWFHHTGNTACVVDPRLCKVVNANRGDLAGKHIRNLSVMTFVSKPKPWLVHKLRNVNWLWMGRSWDTVWKHPSLLLEGGALLLLGLAGWGWLAITFVRRRSPAAVVIFAMTAGFLAMNVAIFTLFQYEWRYSQPLRTMMYFLPVLALGTAITGKASEPEPPR